MKLFKHIVWLSAALCGVALTGCDLREDLTECPVEMRLTFKFSRHGEALLGREVPSLSVFAFDGDDRFVGRWDEMDFNAITADYTMTLPLDPDTYRFVVWGGLVDDNFYLSSPGKGHGYVLTPEAGQTPFDEFAVRIARNTRNHYTGLLHFVDAVPGALFFGSTPKTDLSGTRQNVDIELVKYSNTINLTVTGLPAAEGTRAGSFPHIDVNLHSPNGGYHFSGAIASDRARLTWPQRNSDHGPDGALTSTIQTLRPVFGNEHTLEFYNTDTGEVIYSADLLDDIIRKTEDAGGKPIYNTQEAVDAEDTYDITIDLSGQGSDPTQTQVGVTVTVNGWQVNDWDENIQ